jgi:ABC-type uncharacterized transport system substrate-binding protein
MKKIFRPIIALIIVAGLLLLLDLDNRKKTPKKELPQIAVFKIASRQILDRSEEGIVKGLEESGFKHGETCNIRFFSAEGDMPTANIIAQNIVSSRYDIVVSISTPALQIMANANRDGGILHVFCAVTDPYISGVGISGPAPHEHPPHLVGIGTFQPVKEAFDVAIKMKPDLKKVGTVWCPGEVCSHACVLLAREKCIELGITLIETSVESTTQVLEAAMSLTARGIDALWLGGDNVVELAIDQLITAANKANIPLFTNNPYNVYGNTIFGLGADYFDVGFIAGKMAADILNGKPTNEIGVENVVPNYLKTNPEALNNIKDKWDINAVDDASL